MSCLFRKKISKIAAERSLKNSVETIDLNDYRGKIPTFVLIKLAWIPEAVFLCNINLGIRLTEFASWQDVGSIPNFPV